MLYTEKPADFSPKIVVTSCFLEHDGRVLLLRRHSRKPQGGTWGMPAGKVDKGETIPEATQREVYEESGVAIELSDLANPLRTFVRWDDFDFEYYMYQVVLDRKPDITLEPNGHTEHRWVTPNEAKQLRLIQDLDACFDLVYA